MTELRVSCGMAAYSSSVQCHYASLDQSRQPAEDVLKLVTLRGKNWKHGNIAAVLVHRMVCDVAIKLEQCCLQVMCSKKKTA
jgi:hypothetical protein